MKISQSMKRSVIVVAAIALLSACQTTPMTAKVEQPEIAGPQWESATFRYTPVTQPSSLFSLSQAQQQEFLSYYYAPENQDTSPNFRLADYLNKLVQHFNYVGETFTASEALSKQSGNCLSLAVLTTALARLVGLDVFYQQVHTPPLYRRINGVLTTSTHVRSIVLEPQHEKQDGVIFFRSRAVIDYFPSASNDLGEYITENAFISMYYQNMAAEEVGNKNGSLAYSYLSEAMKLDDTNPETINTLAVLYRKHGLFEKARSLYEFVIENDNKSIHTLTNYAVLLDSVGDKQALDNLGELYLRADDSNPYRWYDLGNDALKKGNYERAEVFFKRAIKEGPYLAEGYLGLSKAHYFNGNIEQALTMMEKAVSFSYLSDNRGLYAAKLEALQRSHE